MTSRWALSFGVLSLALLPSVSQAQTPIRIATWNIETVGTDGSTEYAAALEVLGRIGAGVVAVNEVASSADTANLEADRKFKLRFPWVR